jgi:hypothetical protein
MYRVTKTVDKYIFKNRKPNHLEKITYFKKKLTDIHMHWSVKFLNFMAEYVWLF